MKTLKTLLTAVVMIFSFSAFAADDAAAEKLTVNYALNSYVDAISKGQLKGLANVLDSDTRFTITRGNKIVIQSKSDVMAFMKENENIKQNCQTAYQFLEVSNNQAVVKVTLKYPGFSKVNLLTMMNTAKGWKITNVASSFE